MKKIKTYYKMLRYLKSLSATQIIITIEALIQTAIIIKKSYETEPAKWKRYNNFVSSEEYKLWAEQTIKILQK